MKSQPKLVGITLKNEEENRLFAEGFRCIVGMDEAGMGPLAGPVVVGAVVLPEEFELPYLNDSKKLTEKRRVSLEVEIKRQARFWSVGEASAEEINKLGIRPATFLAYARALEAIEVADYLLVDAFTLPSTSLPQQGIIKGDTKIASIASASILAKTHRDAIMTRMHEAYPLYGFGQHKGYGTKQHLRAIRDYGPCQEHRTSWGVFTSLCS